MYELFRYWDLFLILKLKGVYLTDLTFIGDGNDSYLDEERGIVNFEKMRKETHVIKDIMLYQQNPYNFNVVEIIRSYFNYIIETKEHCLSEKENFKLSRQYEPKSMIESLNSKFSISKKLSLKKRKSKKF